MNTILERFKTELLIWWDAIIEQSPYLLVGIVFLLIFLFLGRFLKRFFIKRFSKRLNDPLLTNFLGNILLWFFIIVGVVIFLNNLGLAKAAMGMLAGAGITAVILGFAFKDLGENLLSGVMLAFSRPFNIGDIVEINSFVGEVKALNLRNTHIRTFNGRDIYIPNSNMIKQALINYTKDGLLRHDFIIGIDYSEPLSEVIAVIDQTLSKETTILHEGELEPFVAIDEFASSTINLKIHFWINSKDFVGSTIKQKTKIMESIVKTLLNQGFNLPAQVIDLKIYNEDQPIPIKLDNWEARTKGS